MRAPKPEIFVQFVEMDTKKDEKEPFTAFWTEKGATVKIRPKVSWAGMINAPNLILGNDDRWPMLLGNANHVDHGYREGRDVCCRSRCGLCCGRLQSPSLKEIGMEGCKNSAICISEKVEELPEFCRAVKIGSPQGQIITEDRFLVDRKINLYAYLLQFDNGLWTTQRFAIRKAPPFHSSIPSLCVFSFLSFSSCLLVVSFLASTR